MLRAFLIFAIFLMSINSVTLMFFPEVFNQTNEQIISKINSTFTTENLQAGETTAITTGNLQPFSTSSQDPDAIPRSSGDTDDTKVVTGFQDFTNAFFYLVGIILNVLAGYINIMLYFGVQTQWIYVIGTIFTFFHGIGLFFFFQFVASTFGGILSFFR